MYLSLHAAIVSTTVYSIYIIYRAALTIVTTRLRFTIYKYIRSHNVCFHSADGLRNVPNCNFELLLGGRAYPNTKMD